MPELTIRKANPEDHDKIWEIFHQVIQKGDTYVFHPDTAEKDLQKLWLSPDQHTYIAVLDNEILGTYMLKSNQIDLGSHVANCGYMVHPKAQRRGLGRVMCEHSMIEARKLGFYSMQFNFVVSTNTGAIKLWEKLGFKKAGIIPEAFQHQEKGLVDVCIMYRKL